MRTLVEIRRLREKYSNLGAQKISPLLHTYCEAQHIHDMGGLRVFPVKITGTGSQSFVHPSQENPEDSRRNTLATVLHLIQSSFVHHMAIASIL